MNFSDAHILREINFGNIYENYRAAEEILKYSFFEYHDILKHNQSLKMSQYVAPWCHWTYEFN